MTGYSGDTIEIKKNKFYKLSEKPNRIEFLHSQYNWLAGFKKLLPLNIPSGLVKLDNGYNMKFYKELRQIKDTDLSSILSLVDVIKTKPHTGPLFHTYLDYVESVANKNNMINGTWKEIRSALEKYDAFANEMFSYCHGDFTIDNLLFVENNIFIIDSNYKENLWQSFYLDYAKLFQELHLKNPLLFGRLVNLLIETKNLNIKDLIFIHLLELTHYIRMLPYLKTYSQDFIDRFSEFTIKTTYTFNLINSTNHILYE